MTLSRFLETLRSQVIVADGAMGSMIHVSAEPGFACTDIVNLSQPECVLGIHVKYLRAGARLIETNTFGANRAKLLPLGLSDKVSAINSRGVKLAREARDIADVDAFIGGSIGPSGLRIRPSSELSSELVDIFREQATALDDRGVDLFMLETFTSRWEIARAIEAVRSVSSLPIVAQMTLPAGDDWGADARLDEDVLRVLEALPMLDADVIGINCTLGPSQVLPALRSLRAFAPDALLSVQPNSGLPRRADGRFVYPATSAQYYARFAQDAIALGASIIGGCCGTLPEQTKAMATAVAVAAGRPTASPIDVVSKPVSPTLPPDHERDTSMLQKRFEQGEFVISMQVDPPKGARTEAIIEACRAFRDSNHVHCIDVNSNAMARLHMDALWMSAKIEAEGIETITHYTPRDASLMGIEGNLLGAWNYGLRNLLIITGDPSMVGGEPGAADVYQTDSIGLVNHVRQLNEGRDCFGNAIGSPPNFYVGVAVNPNHPNLDLEVERFKRKLDAGAQYAMTQVFFEWSCWERFLEKLGGSCPIPTMVAVWPLTSFRLARRLHNEVPGIVIPEQVRKRLFDAGSGARAEGFALARQMLQEAPARAQGAYIIAPFKRPRAALELFE
jgi:homocysteine S-methyltransferase